MTAVLRALALAYLLMGPAVKVLTTPAQRRAKLRKLMDDEERRGDGTTQVSAIIVASFTVAAVAIVAGWIG